MALATYCQGPVPASEIVAAIRPVAVFVCAVGAAPARGLVDWHAPDWTADIYAFEGRNSRDPQKRPRSEWLPEAAARIRAKLP